MSVLVRGTLRQTTAEEGHQRPTNTSELLWLGKETGTSTGIDNIAFYNRIPTEAHMC